MKKKKYVKLKIENTITIAIIFVLAITFASGSYLKAEMQSYNSELQRLKSKIQTQEQMNASIQMKINELASLDKVREVAKDVGLSYNNDNIKVIEES